MPEHPYVPTQAYRDHAFDLVAEGSPGGIHLIHATVVDRLRYAAVERERMVALALNGIARVRLGETWSVVFSPYRRLDSEAAAALDEARSSLLLYEQWLGESAPASTFADFIHESTRALAIDAAVRSRFDLPAATARPSVSEDEARDAVQEAARRAARGAAMSGVQLAFAPAEVPYRPRHPMDMGPRLMRRAERFSRAEEDLLVRSALRGAPSTAPLLRLHERKLNERVRLKRMQGHHADVAFLHETLRRTSVMRSVPARPGRHVGTAVGELRRRLAAGVTLYCDAMCASAHDRVTDVAYDRLT